jgi:hypothetical protein
MSTGSRRTRTSLICWHQLPKSTSLGAKGLTLAELNRRLADGGRFVQRTIDRTDGAELQRVGIPLFVVSSKGELRALTDRRSRTIRRGDKVIEFATPDR